MAGDLKDDMGSPESSPDCKFVKFYSSDVHDEVDSHFARALSAATMKSESPEESPKSERTCIAELWKLEQLSYAMNIHQYRYIT